MQPISKLPLYVPTKSNNPDANKSGNIAIDDNTALLAIPNNKGVALKIINDLGFTHKFVEIEKSDSIDKAYYAICTLHNMLKSIKDNNLHNQFMSAVLTTIYKNIDDKDFKKLITDLEVLTKHLTDNNLHGALRKACVHKIYFPVVNCLIKHAHNHNQLQDALNSQSSNNQTPLDIALDRENEEASQCIAKNYGSQININNVHPLTRIYIQIYSKSDITSFGNLFKNSSNLNRLPAKQKEYLLSLHNELNHSNTPSAYLAFIMACGQFGLAAETLACYKIHLNFLKNKALHPQINYNIFTSYAALIMSYQPRLALKLLELGLTHYVENKQFIKKDTSIILETEVVNALKKELASLDKPSKYKKYLLDEDSNIFTILEKQQSALLDINKYPCIENTDHINYKILNLDPKYAYIFCTDRWFLLHDPENRAYGPTMFDDEAETTGEVISYVENQAKALCFMLKQEKITFEVLLKTNLLCRGIKDDDIRSLFSFGFAHNGSADASHYFFCDFLNRQEDIDKYNKFLLNINPCQAKKCLGNQTLLIFDQNKTPHYQGLIVSYPNVDYIRYVYDKAINEYYNLIMTAKTEEQKIAAILLFVARVETAHGFANANNRLACQNLLNCLLIKNGLPPCILLIPNGISHAIMLSVFFQGIVTEKIVTNINKLVESILPTIWKAVYEGIVFYKNMPKNGQTLQQALDSYDEVKTE